LFFLERLLCRSVDFASFFRIFKHGLQPFGSTHHCGSNHSGETLSLRRGETTHLVPTHRGPAQLQVSNLKNSNMPTPSPTCSSKSFGTA
jgi:hypothetical protein